MDSQFSQTKKARAARKWRKQTSEKKRFGGTLKEYIRIKYGDIYQEYLEFFQRLDVENPNVRDLTKTRMFRKWVKSIQKERQQTQTSQQEEVQNQPPINQTDQQMENLPDILSLAVQEILPEGIPEQVSASLEQFLPQVNSEENDTLSGETIEDIVAELEQNQAVREILDPVVDEIIDRHNIQITPDDDEGIELSFIDEIDVQPFDIDEIDLQPFDYNLEVDF